MVRVARLQTKETRRETCSSIILKLSCLLATIHCSTTSFNVWTPLPALFEDNLGTREEAEESLAREEREIL